MGMWGLDDYAKPYANLALEQIRSKAMYAEVITGEFYSVCLSPGTARSSHIF
jgi:hypothetical protein